MNATFAGQGVANQSDEKFGSESHQEIQVFMGAVRESVEWVDPHLYKIVLVVSSQS